MNAHVSTEGSGLADYEVNRQCGFVRDSKKRLSRRSSERRYFHPGKPWHEVIELQLFDRALVVRSIREEQKYFGLRISPKSPNRRQ